MFSPQSILVIKPHGGVPDSDYFSYTLIDSLLGLLTGFGDAALVVNLTKVNSRIWRAITLSTIVLTVTIISGVISVLQEFKVAFTWMGLGTVVQIIIGCLEQAFSNGTRRS